MYSAPALQLDAYLAILRAILDEGIKTDNLSKHFDGLMSQINMKTELGFGARFTLLCRRLDTH